MEIITEMKDKLKRFSLPRNFALVPVLIHFGEVAYRVHELQYFYRIIDIADLMEVRHSVAF